MDLVVVGLLLALAAGLADVLGGLLSASARVRTPHLPYLLALSAGFILAVTLLERIPHAVEELPGALGYVLAGYLVLYLAEGVFAAHAHHHSAHDHSHGSHALVGSLGHEEPLITRHAGVAAFIGLLVHAFFDGAAIVAGFIVSAQVGVLLFVAVALHKVPEGLSMGSIALASGRSRKEALLTASALGAATVLGAIVSASVGAQSPYLVNVILALASGSFLYVAATDLVPAANESRARTAVGFLFAGVALFLVSEYLIEASGLAV